MWSMRSMETKICLAKVAMQITVVSFGLVVDCPVVLTHAFGPGTVNAFNAS